jgi:hypothetical protein
MVRTSSHVLIIFSLRVGGSTQGGYVTLELFVVSARTNKRHHHQGEAGAHSTTPTYTVGRDSPARKPSWSAFWLQKPSILRACVREEDAGGREAGAHSTTPTYTVRRDSPAREPMCVCVFITAGPSTKLFTWGGGGYGRTCATRDDEPRPVWNRGCVEKAQFFYFSTL